jgi:uncharacterized protein YbbC (DUF1343 family)
VYRRTIFEFAGKLYSMGVVQTGSDVLANGGYKELRGKKVGFVGNHASVHSDGTPTHLGIHSSQNGDLIRLFSPEHGAFGILDHEGIADDIDPATGLTIHSLYGDTRKPTPEMLAGLDALVFELQDIGARFYTYASTMLLCLEACHEAGIELILLDRPNPITGTHVEGPLPDPDKLSFTCCHSIPIRHGLTLGELALLAAHERGMENSVTVVPCYGWSRKMWWDQTEIPWINPSPAMRSLESAMLYPGVCLLEQTDISVGRGTTTPFLEIGAPWTVGWRWAAFLNNHTNQCVKAIPTIFTPMSSKFAGSPCNGIRLHVLNRARINSVHLGLLLCISLYQFWPHKFDLTGVNKLLANDRLIASIKDGTAIDNLDSITDATDFLARSKEFQLYD